MPGNQAPLNPERVPQLLGKYAKSLGKDLDKIVVTYDADGISIGIFGMKDTVYASLNDASVAEYKAIKAKQNEPSDAERLQAFKNKFELRLNLEFPREGGPTSGKEADIQSFLNGLGFRMRRALMMTQKQFEKSYPNGFSQA